MMKRLQMLWKALDEIPGAATDRLEWHTLLGSEWLAACHYLKPVGTLAREIACPSPGGDGCPRKAVLHEDGRVRAVCGQRPTACEALDLARDDIAILALDRKQLAHNLAGVLGAVPELRDHGQFVEVGAHGVAAGVSVPIFLVLPGPSSDGGDDLEDRLDGIDAPAAIVVPTADSLQRSVAHRVKARGNLVLTLGEIVTADNTGKIMGCAPAETILHPLRQHLIEMHFSSSESAWRLPPDARWPELILTFTADGVISALFRQDARRFEPSDLGMRNGKNGRPTLAWTLLLHIAEYGGLSWKDPHAGTRMKKQKSTLSKKLRDAFKIPGEPIVWRSNSYQPLFVLRDARPKGAR